MNIQLKRSIFSRFINCLYYNQLIKREKFKLHCSYDYFIYFFQFINFAICFLFTNINYLTYRVNCRTATDINYILHITMSHFIIV